MIITAETSKEELIYQCAICGSTSASIRIADVDYNISQCNTCGAGATLPPEYVTQSHYNFTPRLAKVYAESEGKTKQYARKYLSFLRSYVPQGRFLDVGCSIGTFVEVASQIGYKAEGIDLDSNAVAYGKELGRAVMLSSLEDHSGDDYDVVFLSHTLEHIPEPLSFLTECAKHLKPGGCLMVVVPCHRGLNPRIFGKRWYGWLPTQHYFHYSRKSLDILMRDAGLTTVRVWQNSMDHRITSASFRNWKVAVKSVVGYCIALIGSGIGQGDQLLGIARLSISYSQGPRE